MRADSITMAEQLRLWGDEDNPAPHGHEVVEYRTPPEPLPEPPSQPTTLDRDLIAAGEFDTIQHRSCC